MARSGAALSPDTPGVAGGSALADAEAAIAALTTSHDGADPLPIDEMSAIAGMLRAVARSLARTVGPRCEVVVHDYREWQRSGSTIVWIENGHVTGRHVGGPTTNLGLEALRSGDASPDRFGYRARTRDGRSLRSSSIYFRNRGGELIGSLCINLDVSAYQEARAALDAIIGTSGGAPSSSTEAAGSGAPDGSEIQETFGEDIGEVLDALIQAAISRTGRTSSALTRDDKVAVVRYLDEKGAFLVKRAAERIARALGISRVTAYTYLEEARAGNDTQNGRRT
jgi:predicted transcriptional regulator YheO